MTQKEYSKLLRDPRWRAKRIEILERDKYTCKLCGKNKEDGVILHVHHIMYHKGLMPWEYRNRELITLCEDCHNNFHKKQKAQIEKKKQSKEEKKRKANEEKEQHSISTIISEIKGLEKSKNDILFFETKWSRYYYYGTFAGHAAMFAWMLATSKGFDITFKMAEIFYNKHKEELKTLAPPENSVGYIMEKYGEELENLYLSLSKETNQ